MQKARLFPVILALLLIIANLTVIAVSPAGAASASIWLSKTSGPRGSTTTVTGKNFPTNTKGSIIVGTVSVGTMRTGSKGGFRLSVTIPSLPPGTAKVVAKVARFKAIASFNVMATTTTTTTTTVPGPDQSTWWKPTPGMSWQWQLTDLPVDLSVEADIYDIDLFDVDASVVTALHDKGRKVICYMSAGSYEDWRSDAGSFPESVLGKDNGWAGERWLDIRAINVLMPIMEARMDLCKKKGFDGVEVDNIDGYTNGTGFPLTPDHQLTYNKRLAKAAHDRGLAIGLKNDLDQIPALVNDFDFAINEECAAYDECAALKPFISANKAVLHAEYGVDTAKFCPTSAALKLSSIRKNLQLDAWRQTCP